jgi:uncharacterized membrane protein YkvA (DUF1232 family)
MVKNQKRKGGLLGWFGALWRIYRDPSVAGWAKALCLGLAILYLISPFDVVPEAITGPLGLLDDALLVPLILSLIQWFIPKGHGQEDASSPPNERKHVKSRPVDRSKQSAQ